MEIKEESPRHEQAIELLREHLADVAIQSPPESIHALDIDALCSDRITFYAAWEGEALLGCGALLELDSGHGEIKSMRTARAQLRRGVGSRIVEHIIDEARGRGYARLSLETGSQDAFAPARVMYAKHGFEVCGPFADYRLDPSSVFMTRRLEVTGQSHRAT